MSFPAAIFPYRSNDSVVGGSLFFGRLRSLASFRHRKCGEAPKALWTTQKDGNSAVRMATWLMRFYSPQSQIYFSV